MEDRKNVKTTSDVHCLGLKHLASLHDTLLVTLSLQAFSNILSKNILSKCKLGGEWGWGGGVLRGRGRAAYAICSHGEDVWRFRTKLHLSHSSLSSNVPFMHSMMGTVAECAPYLSHLNALYDGADTVAECAPYLSHLNALNDGAL